MRIFLTVFCACLVLQFSAFAQGSPTDTTNVANAITTADENTAAVDTSYSEFKIDISDNNKRWLIKVNLLNLAAGITNIGVEYSFKNKFSVDIPVTYSPYTISRTYKLRTLSIQPELRWWLNTQLAGHFFGFHTHLAYYNVALNKNNRYQDKNGNTPLFGFGFSYGYALYSNEKWNFEFTLGIGYAHLNYDVFYNVSNGAEHQTKTKNYWGLTKAGITLSYKLKNKNHD
ncbi:MAG: DUF3575 domain-containing protein [Prevotellaceae bacterium]|jgi:hypothetical protein|nr:DUF3575 domain-containing protein [Prevotellaceae bacterium]